MKPNTQFIVALLIQPDLSARREALRGIHSYAASRSHLELSLLWAFGKEAWEPLRAPHLHGALVWPGSEQEKKFIAKLSIPVVTVGSVVWPGVPSVGFDNRAAAEVGIQALSDRGLKNFAFYSCRNDARYGWERLEQYKAFIAANGLVSHIHYGTEATRAASLGAWMEALPKPVGILADIDSGGLDLISTAARRGIRIPDEVAVVSIGGDDLTCSMAFPPLSSVMLPGFEAGQEALRILEELMKRKRSKIANLVLAPRGITERRSSEFMPKQDPHVQTALRYIRENAERELTVAHVLQVVPLSRRPLERRFKELTGKTLQKAIWMVKLDRAAQLLKETNLSIAEIADRCGFTQPHHMTQVFRRERGITPRDLRALNQTHSFR